MKRLLAQKTQLLKQKEELYEAELLARARAESAMRAREEVLAIVSHDLRNPMSTILASSGSSPGDSAPKCKSRPR